MVRTALYLASGLVLGLFIHLIVILTLPALASNDIFVRISALDAKAKILLLDTPAPGTPNPLRLDPDLSYAVCQLDLADGPGVLRGTLPLAFWSVAVFDRSGTVIYSTTNRDGIGQTIDVGIFNPAQTSLLAEQKIDIEPGLLIVESPRDEVFVVVRLAPPQLAMQPRYAEQIKKLACGNIKV